MQAGTGAGAGASASASASACDKFGSDCGDDKIKLGSTPIKDSHEFQQQSPRDHLAFRT